MKKILEKNVLIIIITAIIVLAVAIVLIFKLVINKPKEDIPDTKPASTSERKLIDPDILDRERSEGGPEWIDDSTMDVDEMLFRLRRFNLYQTDEKMKENAEEVFGYLKEKDLVTDVVFNEETKQYTFKYKNGQEGSFDLIFEIAPENEGKLEKIE